MQQKFVVLGLESESRYEKGEVVEKFWVYYFKPELSNSRLLKGFTLTKVNCHSILDFSDFETVPGIYNFDYTIVKSEPILKGVSLSGEFPVNEVENSLLILSAKPSEFETEDGKTMKGISCQYVDSTGYMETSDLVGYIPSKGWCDKTNFSLFAQVPGYYSLDMDHYRNRKGEAVIKISNPKFVRPFLNNQQQAA